MEQAVSRRKNVKIIIAPTYDDSRAKIALLYCSVYGKVHIKDPLLLIEKSSLCGGSGFPSKKKCVNMTI